MNVMSFVPYESAALIASMAKMRKSCSFSGLNRKLYCVLLPSNAALTASSACASRALSLNLEVATTNFGTPASSHAVAALAKVRTSDLSNRTEVKITAWDP
eukprot:CAMPEP_0180705826 /NCGR_PEP_ID=MMETSP1038_2-20121128/7878_1 /TAXON_ID=632150 /ORGANISM="Azadinium spinosum, Strain 3D9" /LENGTH=100 /DNA_ID=CAMNT_0022737715 /DNA_START=63 /DNA_END=365 /DNA_ORIENTATION=-